MSLSVNKNIYYTTSTILEWANILTNEKLVSILYDSWEFLVSQQRVNIYAFVIMPNHIHWLYEVLPPYENENIKHSFLSFTAKRFLDELDSDKEQFMVYKSNRTFQIWKSPSLSVPIYSKKFFFQKMNYIHKNPVKSGLAQNPEDYLHSSSNSYKKGIAHFNFLSIYQM